MKKIYIAVAVVATLIVGYVLGYTTRPQQATYVAGAVGDTQATPKMAQIVGNANGTYVTANNRYQYASLYNSDANDRIVESVEWFADALSTVSTSTDALKFLMATSSTASGAIGSNYLLNTTVATSAPASYVASTTPGDTSSSYKRIWAAGTYLNLESNATSSTGFNLKVNYMAK